MDFNDNTTRIILAIIGIAAVGGAIFSIRKSKKKSQDRNTVTNGDIIGGDKVGGDKIGGSKTNSDNQTTRK
jgi:hypothetical protein